MLRYSEERTPEGIRVRFREFDRKVRQISLMSGMLALSALPLWYVPRLLSLRGALRILLDVPILLVFALAALVSLFAAVLLSTEIPSSRFLFRPDGIRVDRSIFGIPIRSRWYSVDEIFGFGFGAHGHSRMTALKFQAVGEPRWIHIVQGLSETEADRFVEHLAESGCAYETSWGEPRRSPTSVRFVTNL